MNKVRKVVEYWRKTDCSYERIELEPSMPCTGESNKSKSLRELAAYSIIPLLIHLQSNGEKNEKSIVNLIIMRNYPFDDVRLRRYFVYNDE